MGNRSHPHTLSSSCLTAQIVIPANSSADNHHVLYEKGASVNRMVALSLTQVSMGAGVDGGLGRSVL